MDKEVIISKNNLKSFFFAICLILAQSGLGQFNFVLQEFRVYSSGDHVALQWTMKPGNTCLGIGIMRSTNNLDFEQIGIIGGVCGSPDMPVSYTFIDSLPVENKLSYYKLILGVLGESQVISIRFINFIKEKYLVQPNPSDNNALLIFSPTILPEVTITLFQENGAKLFEERIFSSDRYQIDAGEFLSYKGLILFNIVLPDGKVLSSGSFLKL